MTLLATHTQSALPRSLVRLRHPSGPQRLPKLVCLLHASAPYFILRPHSCHHRHRVTFERGAIPCSTSLTSHTVPVPLRPLTQSRAARRQPSGLGRSLLGCLPLSRPCSGVERLPGRHSCSESRSTHLFFSSSSFFVCFCSSLRFPIPPELFWPGLASERQPDSSTAAFSDRLQPFPCYTLYT